MKTRSRHNHYYRILYDVLQLLCRVIAHDRKSYPVYLLFLTGVTHMQYHAGVETSLGAGPSKVSSDRRCVFFELSVIFRAISNVLYKIRPLKQNSSEIEDTFHTQFVYIHVCAECLFEFAEKLAMFIYGLNPEFSHLRIYSEKNTRLIHFP